MAFLVSSPNAAEMPKLGDTFCRPATNWQEQAEAATQPADAKNRNKKPQ